MSFPAFIRAIPVLLIGMGASPALSAAIVLRCTLTQTVTDTSGYSESFARTRTIRIGDMLYQDGSASAGWGENLCAMARCSLREGRFSYRLDDRHDEAGLTLRHQAVVSIDQTSGVFDAKEETSELRLVTGFESETTIYEHGRCDPIRGPADETTAPGTDKSVQPAR